MMNNIKRPYAGNNKSTPHSMPADIPYWYAHHCSIWQDFISSFEDKGFILYHMINSFKKNIPYDKPTPSKSSASKDMWRFYQKLLRELYGSRYHYYKQYHPIVWAWYEKKSVPHKNKVNSDQLFDIPHFHSIIAIPPATMKNFMKLTVPKDLVDIDNKNMPIVKRRCVLPLWADSKVDTFNTHNECWINMQPILFESGDEDKIHPAISYASKYLKRMSGWEMENIGKLMPMLFGSLEPK
jgi:hypothetical protein